MGKRPTADQIQRLLREADRDLTKGLTVADVCRTFGIAPITDYRWRQCHDPAVVADARRVHELKSELERLKRLAAELMLAKHQLQDVAPKVVTADQPRVATDDLAERFGVTQRYAAPLLGRRRPASRSGNFPLEMV